MSQLHIKRVVKQLNARFLAAEVYEIIHTALFKRPGSTEPFTANQTLGEFQRTSGFHGSQLYLHYLVGTYVARFMRRALMNGLVNTFEAMEVMALTDPAEYEAAKILNERLLKELGPVSDERIKELDQLVASWHEQNKQRMQQLQP